MSGRLLDFKSYVGGADNVVVEEVFPTTSKTFKYDYGTDVSSYTFAATHQTLVVDAVAYDRNTGLPNFTDSKIIGYFGSGSGTAIASSNITNNGAAGTVDFTIPAGLYTGPIIPSARTNVPLTIVTFTWTDPNGALPDIVESHRWCLMQRWASTVSPADPTLDSNFVQLGTGGVLTFTDNSATDADRVVGAYSVTGLSSKEGTGATFSVQVTTGGVTNVDITARGTGYNVGDTIELLDVNMGGGGAADITVTVASVA
tara:strand:- start:2864 stop:3634 length:771 start_codon:yes stop_codon:yes gene_type:complete